MKESVPLLDPAFLQAIPRERTRQAEARGALRHIETSQRLIEDGGVRFLVRAVSSLERKKRVQERPSGKDHNPFLPPEPALTLGAISDTHLCLLNKFNVLEQHLLIVTRRFEHQESLLDRADFEALCLVLQGIDGLGFYNGRAAAGASQPHKHLQLVPLPLLGDGPDLPLEPLLLAGIREGIATLPFAHAVCPLPAELWQGFCTNPMAAAAVAHDRCLELLARLGIGARLQQGSLHQTAPYNLLMRRGWMLLAT